MFKYLKDNLTKGLIIFDPLDYEINWVPIRADELHPVEQASIIEELYTDAEGPLQS